jgi:hypothetical protein
MSAFPDWIGIKAARQGGFTSVNLPAPLLLNPPEGGPWGLGWLLEETTVSNDRWDTTTVTVISADGTSSATTTVDHGSTHGPHGRWVMPINGDRFLVALGWRVNENYPEPDNNNGDKSSIWVKVASSSGGQDTYWGPGRRGFLVSRNSAAALDITSDLADYLWPDGSNFPGQFGSTAKPYAAPHFRLQTPNWTVRNQWSAAQVKSDVYDAAAANGGSWWHWVYNGFPVVADTGIFYDDTAPEGGGDWRLGLGAASGFNDAITSADAVAAADEGSVWLPNFTGWDDKPFEIERFIDDSWQPWGGGVALGGTRVSVDPSWKHVKNEWEEFETAFFAPLVSIPFTDRTAWFSSEFGMTV